AMLRHDWAKRQNPRKPDLTNAVQDMRQALSVEFVKSYPLAYDAARLFALASKENNELRKEALDWLESAVGNGADRDRLTREPLFQPLQQEPRFKKLLQEPTVPVAATPQIRLLDPIDDE